MLDKLLKKENNIGFSPMGGASSYGLDSTDSKTYDAMTKGAEGKSLTGAIGGFLGEHGGDIIAGVGSSVLSGLLGGNKGSQVVAGSQQGQSSLGALQMLLSGSANTRSIQAPSGVGYRGGFR